MTKAMRDADCWSNHHLIIAKLNLHIQSKRRPQGQKFTNRVNVTKLKNTETVNDLQSVMNRNLSNLPTPSNDIEEALASFRDTAHSTALEVLGLTTRNHQTPVIHVLLEEKRRLLRANHSDPSCPAEKAVFINLRSQIQTKLRSLQDTWFSAKADETQGYADRHETKRFYTALNAVYVRTSTLRVLPRPWT